jgi:aromatic ring-opening dioxygenase LigB subunit
MPIQGAFILPHGSLILDPSIESLSEQAQHLHDGMLKISEKIKEISPDICLFITPHGISHETHYCFYDNLYAEGTAEWEGKYGDFRVKIELDNTQTQEIVEFLQNHDNEVSRITAFTKNSPIQLRWGEVVPLWFLRKIPISYLIMSIPTKRYSQLTLMIPELQKLGKDLQAFFAKSDTNAIIIVSGDLAHTHLVSGPYGFKNEAATFDRLISEWVSQQQTESLLGQSLSIIDEALCCGFSSFVILDQLLKGLNFNGRVFSEGHPTYYGMLIAEFG